MNDRDGGEARRGRERSGGDHRGRGRGGRRARRHGQRGGRGSVQGQGTVQDQQSSPKHETRHRHRRVGNAGRRDQRQNASQPLRRRDEAEVREMVLRGELYSGILRVQPAGDRNAYITVPQFSNDIFIDGKVDKNQSIDGDLVAVKLKPNTDWIKIAARDGQVASSQPVGRVIAVLERDPTLLKNVVGFFDRPAFLLNFQHRRAQRNGRYLMFIPRNRKLPTAKLLWNEVPSDMQVPFAGTTLDDDPYDQLFAVDYESDWNPSQRMPVCHLRANLGRAGDLDVERSALLQACNISQSDEFPQVVDQEVQAFEDWAIPESEIANRRDLREWRIFSIDPPTARDLDDALSIRRLNNGNYEIGVHIADVTYFVKQGSPVDLEARRRATSVYLVERVIPMLPRILCDKLCSLKPGADRLAISAVWKMTPEGCIVNDQPTWFGRSIIRSCAHLHYGVVQDMIEGRIACSDDLPSYQRPSDGHMGDDVISDCLTLNRIAVARRAYRFSSGSLSLNKPRIMVRLNDQGLPEGIELERRCESKFLVEEYMLLANMLVADFISTKAPEVALLRRHPPPLESRLNQTISVCNKMGYPLSGYAAGELHESLVLIEREHGDLIRGLIEMMLVRSMQTAEYFTVGLTDSREFWLHYALNFETYTHFTSPIRRYADIIVHRQLSFCLKDPHAAPLLDARDIDQISKNCNLRKTNARDASANSQLVYVRKWLEADSSRAFDAYVIGIGQADFQLFVPLYGFEESMKTNDLVTRCGAVSARIKCIDSAGSLVLEDRKEDHSSSEDAAGKEIEINWSSGELTQRFRLFSNVKVRATISKGKRARVYLDIIPPT